jgi:citrate synthase
MDTNKTEAKAGGLDGVVVADTRLSEVDGERGRLIIAGHDVESLVGRVSFEEVVALLERGSLPDELERERVRASLAEARLLAFEKLPSLGDALARPDGMDALRASLAHLGEAEGFGAARRLVGAMAVFAAAWARARLGLTPIAPDASLAHAADYLRMIRGEPAGEARAAALDAYLATVSDHGMNASTFAARVVTSTGSDAVSAVVAALGALKGPLHGGAPGPVLDMLDAIGRPEDAEPWIEGELLAGRRIMGMGHRIYRVRDPRAAVLERATSRLERPACAPAASPSRAPSSAPPRASFAGGTPIARSAPTSSSTPRCSSTRWASIAARSRPPSPWAASPAGARTSTSSAARAA